MADRLLRTITTGNRRRQNVLAEMLMALFKSHLVGISPITYSFSKSIALISVRNGSFASISLIRVANSRIVRDNLLYLKNSIVKRSENRMTPEWIAHKRKNQNGSPTLCSLHVFAHDIFVVLLLRANCCQLASAWNPLSSAVFLHDTSVYAPFCNFSFEFCQFVRK